MATAIGIVTALLVGMSFGWHYAPALGWIAAASAYLSSTWLLIGRMNAEATARHVRQRREDGNATSSHTIVLIASVASLGGVGYLLSAGSGPDDHLTAAAIGSLSVVASWLAIHTTYALRYAVLYYVGEELELTPIDFHQRAYRPCYADFGYLAFTVGMTYQVSDTDLTARRVRGTVLTHALISFLLGAVILAVTINLVASLAGGGG